MKCSGDFMGISGSKHKLSTYFVPGIASFVSEEAHSTDGAECWGHQVTKTGHLPSDCSW